MGWQQGCACSRPQRHAEACWSPLIAGIVRPPAPCFRRLPCSGGAGNVGGAKPSTTAGGMLLPPQLRQAGCFAAVVSVHEVGRCGACRLDQALKNRVLLCACLLLVPSCWRGSLTPAPCHPLRCRGRANVATEDLSTMFTKQAVQRAQQRRSSGGGASGSASGDGGGAAS